MAKPKKVVRTKRLYKKHTPNKKALRTVLFILIVIILVGFGYIVSMEWAKRFGPNAPKSSITTPSLPTIDETDDNTVSSDVLQSKPEKPNNLELVNAKYVNADEIVLLTQDQFKPFFDKIKANGYNSVIVELKSDKGLIYYNTNNEMAKKYGAISEKTVDINALVSAINSSGLTPIAKISTLKDAKAPHVSNENSYAYGTQVATNWLDDSFDRGGKPWLNPYMDNARKYIVDLSKEISDAGFKSIVLENVMFPDKNTGKLNTINQTKSYDLILKQLVDEVQESVKDTKVYVSYNPNSFIKTKENKYYVSAKDINHKNVVLTIENLNNGNQKELTLEQKNENAKVLLEKVISDMGDDASIIIYVKNKKLETDIKSTIESFDFKNQIS